MQDIPARGVTSHCDHPVCRLRSSQQWRPPEDSGGAAGRDRAVALAGGPAGQQGGAGPGELTELFFYLST